MFSSFEKKGALGIQVMLAPISSEISRLWACNACGSKIYQRSITTEPQYQCLCGQRGWQPVKVVRV